MSHQEYKIRMPDGVQKYKIWMPDGVFKYKIYLGCEQCLTPNIFPNPNDFTTWNTTNTIVTSNIAESPGCTQDADEVNLIDHTSQFFLQVPGNTPDAPVDLKFWFKYVGAGGVPAPPALRIEHPISGLNGEWTLDLTDASIVVDEWFLLDDSHPAVTVSSSFKIDSSGNLYINMRSLTSGVELFFQLWCSYAVEI